jgi:hypothetical protein
MNYARFLGTKKINIAVLVMDLVGGTLINQILDGCVN